MFTTNTIICPTCGNTTNEVKSDIFQATRNEPFVVIGHSAFCPHCKVSIRLKGHQLGGHVDVSYEDVHPSLYTFNLHDEDEANLFAAWLKGQNVTAVADGEEVVSLEDLSLYYREWRRRGDGHSLTQECFEAGTDWPTEEQLAHIREQERQAQVEYDLANPGSGPISTVRVTISVGGNEVDPSVASCLRCEGTGYYNLPMTGDVEFICNHSPEPQFHHTMRVTGCGYETPGGF